MMPHAPIIQHTPNSQEWDWDHFQDRKTANEKYDLVQTQTEWVAPTETKKVQSGPKYNYRPTALRSWFLLLVAAFSLACVALIEYSIRTELSANEVNKVLSNAKRRDVEAPMTAYQEQSRGNYRLSPKGMPHFPYDKPDLVERVPGSEAFMPSGQSRFTQSPTQVGSHTTEITTSEKIITEKIVTETITPTSTSDPPEKITATVTPPQTTVITTVVRISSITSVTVVLPEVVSTSTDITTDSSGDPTTILYVTTLQQQRTTTQTYEVTPVSGQSFITTVITSTLGEASAQPNNIRTTLIDRTTVVPAVTTDVLETRTDALGHLITTMVETTIPAHTITEEIISTIDGGDDDDGNGFENAAVETGSDSIDIASYAGFETQRRMLASSTKGPPNLLVVFSTVSFATVIETTIPTVVPDPSGGGNGTELQVLGLTSAEYFSATFLPTILAVVLSFFLEVISTNTKLMQPFLTLASSPGGATAESSVFLGFDRWLGAFIIPQAIKLRQPLVGITQLIIIGSAIIAPLSSEALGVYTANSCTASCYGKIAVQKPAARALQGLLGATAILLIIVVLYAHTKGWKTGVNHNPWSIAGMASLCLNPEVKVLLSRMAPDVNGYVSEEDIVKVLGGLRYKLGDFSDPSRHESGESHYGLLLVGNDSSQTSQSTQLQQNEHANSHENRGEWHRDIPQAQAFSDFESSRLSSWLIPLRWWFRAATIFFVTSSMILIAYYQESGGDSGFEVFMDSRGFGVHFFFTALGVVLGGLMDAIFDSEYPSFSYSQPPLAFEYLTYLTYRYFRYDPISPAIPNRSTTTALHTPLDPNKCLLRPCIRLSSTKSPSWHIIVYNSPLQVLSPSHAGPCSIFLQHDMVDPASMCMAQPCYHGPNDCSHQCHIPRPLALSPS